MTLTCVDLRKHKHKNKPTHQHRRVVKVRWVRREKALGLSHHSGWSLPPSNPALFSSRSLFSLTVSCVLEVPSTHRRHCVHMAWASAMMVTLEEK